MNTRILYPLLRPTVHAVNWLPVLAGAALGTALVLVPEALTTKLTQTHLTTLLRLAAACAALGTAFLLDDPATRSIPTVPTARLVRNLVRILVAAAGLVIWWFALLRVATAAAHHPIVTRLPGPGLSLEAAALTATALALAATAQRRSNDGNCGIIAAPVLLAFAALAWFLPYRAALVVGPDDAHWAVAHQRWAVVLVVALAAFVWASHDRTVRRRRTAAASWPRGHGAPQRHDHRQQHDHTGT